MYSTQPAVVVYTANWLNQKAPYIKHSSVCLEMQQLPNAINMMEKEGWPQE